jgi:hypothetical protein
MSKHNKSSKKKHQKFYRMKGCSKKTRRCYLGGSNSNFALAFPSNNIPKVSNPMLAYTGRGGGSCSGSNLAAAYPSKGAAAGGFNFINSQPKRGGSCGACSLGMRGGSQNLSNNGIPYPDGLVGDKWTPAIGGWPGVDGIPGNRNFLGINTYEKDVPLQMKSVGANPPFLGGSRRKRRKNRSKRRGKRGGAMTNLIGQDFINLGRQATYGLGSAYNGFVGVKAPTNPLPWKDQLMNTPNLSSFKMY